MNKPMRNFKTSILIFIVTASFTHFVCWAEDIEIKKTISEKDEALRKMEAAIVARIDKGNSLPIKTMITPNTRVVGYAMYYSLVAERIIKFANLNPPQIYGKKLYGKGVMYLPIYQDGKIWEVEGGQRIETSSGIEALDRAMIRIIRRASPFGKFPTSMRKSSNEVWELVFHFEFKNEDAQPSNEQTR
ncbi:hypothetical protein BH11PSE12_BH11PSE12_34620 [soil metagenome]